MRAHQRAGVGQRRVGADGHRVDHHAGFELLDLADLLGLLGRRQIAVDDADAAGLRHGNGQPRFGDRVHRRRQDRRRQLDVAGDPGARRRSRPGITSEWPGCSSTSSKVSASAPVAVSMIFAMANPRINANGAEPWRTAPTRDVPFQDWRRAGTTSPRRWEGDATRTLKYRHSKATTGPTALACRRHSRQSCAGIDR